MTTIVTRAGKGSPLTHTEVDTNFTNLNTNKLETAAIPLGTAAAPSISFLSDADSGLFSPGANQVAVATNGTQRLLVSSAGDISIGTTSKASNTHLDLYSTSSFAQYIRFRDEVGASGLIGYDHVTDSLQLYTSGTERLRLTSTGQVRLAGAGITFNGDTAAANELDDYEEGTWTYGFTSTTGTITKDSNYVYGNYTKVGRLVTVTGFLAVSSVSSPTGTLTLTGLPFAIRSSNNREDFVGGGIYGSSLSATSVSPLMISGSKGDSSLTILKFASGSQANLAGDVLADTRFQISFSYFTG